MNDLSMTLKPDLVNKFVPARSGAELYAAGQRLRDCVTPTQRAEWLNAYECGRVAYYTAMSEANDYGPSIEDDHSWIRTGC